MEKTVKTPYWRSLAMATGGLAFVLGLGGCSSIGDALGFSKRPPDEYEIVSKAPLVVPPDYGLRPPAEQELSLKEKNPRDLAFRAIFPAKPKSQGTMPAVPADDVGSAPLPEQGGFSEGVNDDAAKNN